MIRYLVACCILVCLHSRGRADDQLDRDYAWQLPVRANPDTFNYLMIGVPNLEHLRVGWPGMTDDTLRSLPFLTQLSHLAIYQETSASLEGGKQIVKEIVVTADGWKELQKLKHLRVLYLSSLSLDEKSLVEISKLANLRVLHLPHCKEPTDAAIRHLSGHKKLAALDVCGSGITDDGFTELVKIKQLEILDISQTKVTDQGLKKLAGLQEIRRLICYQTQVSDEGLKHLVDMKKLKYVDLRDTKVTDQGKEWLRTQRPDLMIFALPR